MQDVKVRNIGLHLAHQFKNIIITMLQKYLLCHDSVFWNLGGKTCINTIGSYKCECPSGYQEDQNGVCQGIF